MQEYTDFSKFAQLYDMIEENKSKFIGEGLTYDDVLLVPAYSEILPHQVTLSTHFSRNIKINTPIVSAAMDTVTELSLIHI